uniref:Peroxin-19 n=2 Tax=Ditylum brightwellii TaxID=49249 RepID=A0A7S4R4K2_9STRA|mmetsp:Transcript_29661/g.39453  ORF Transcript_29661/g.39453 Transcript_29661/m.39453 type:complete len:364 (-) Transcript_29661:45-1136(-)
MSKENTERKRGVTKKKKSKDLDSVLDAALDDLDDDNGDNVDEEDIKEPTSKSPPKETPTKLRKASSSKSKKKAQAEKDVFSEEDLAASLEDVMKQLLQAGEQLQSHDTHNEENMDEAEKMLEQFMKQMQGFQEETASPSSSSQTKSKSQPSKNKKQPSSPSTTPQQQTPSATSQTEGEGGTDVDKTVAKMLDDMAKANAAASTTSIPSTETANFDEMGEQMMSSMMAEFQNMAEKEDADDVIEGMMKQLLSKELMYDPMKQVLDKFPKWLAEHKDHLTEEDYQRYGQQYQYFQRIVAVYETDPNNFSRLMELMQDIQEYGQPPAEIIKELAPDLEFDEEGMPKMDGPLPGMPPFPGNEQCNVM